MTSEARGGRRLSRAGLAALTAVSLAVLGLGVTSASAVEPKIVVQDHEGSATALDVSWSDVKGAAAYRVRYSTDDNLKKSVQTAPDVTKGEETTISGLDTGTSYYVQVTALDDKGSTLGASTVVRAAATYPYQAPGDIYATKVTDTTMTLSWKSVGDTPGYLVDVVVNDKKTTVATDKASVDLTGLKKQTDYSVRVRAAKDGDALSRNSPYQTVRTSRYPIAAPDGLAQGAQGAFSFRLSWDDVKGLAKGQGYVVEWSLSTDFTRPTRSRLIAGSKTTIDNLRRDQTYYTHIWVVDAKSRRISEVSDYITTKTLPSRGTLVGQVSGAPSGDLMAVAYDKNGNAARQVPVSDGRYEIPVRNTGSPYKVQILYVGTDPNASYVSTFAHTKGSGWVISQGARYTVRTGQATKVADVAIKRGNVLSGRVFRVGAKKNDKGAIRDVDVTVISGVDPTNAKAEREVIGMARTDARGAFRITGLADGPYWIRFHYVGGGKGFKTLSRHLSIKQNLGVDVKLAKR